MKHQLWIATATVLMLSNPGHRSLRPIRFRARGRLTRPAQVFIFKASGDRFGGIACGPCDRAASVFRVEDGRMDGERLSFVVSYGADGPRFKELGAYRDRVAGTIVNGRLSLTRATRRPCRACIDA